MKIAFDEWNLRGWHHPGFPRKQVSQDNDPATAALIARREENAIASQYTMADALFSASFLNACLRHADDVGMANIAPMDKSGRVWSVALVNRHPSKNVECTVRMKDKLLDGQYVAMISMPMNLSEPSSAPMVLRRMAA